MTNVNFYNKIDKVFWHIYMLAYPKVVRKLLPRQLLFKVILDKLEVKDGYRYLDAGCGFGELCTLIQKKGGIAVGIDRSKKVLEGATKLNPDVKFKVVDLNKEQELDFNSTFNGIVSVNTLYLIDTFKEVNGRKIPITLFYFNDWLKKGGRLVIVIPLANYSQLRKFVDHFKLSVKKSGYILTFLQMVIYFPLILIVVLMNIYVKFKGSKGHYFFYTPDDFELMIKSVGFKIISNTLCYSDQNVMIVAEKL
ncbi:methyltransferase domain-containing protein [Candidatus Parcubacteria bacterium]|nr:MAG: methyltransferase domain-containing protein [Candidatus Parcubacteria bacterium]